MNDSSDLTGLEPGRLDPADADEANVYTLHRGTTALLVSAPHVGTAIPADLRACYAERAHAVEDTDWHLDRLYDFVREMGASLLVPRHSRYVIDLNRPPQNAPMYPGVNNTELCPTRFFTGDALYRDAQAPLDDEIARRLERYWQPYHRALEAELARLEGRHGHAIVFDAHSIKSELPWLFEGRLTDLNLGTVDGASCAPSLRSALARVLEAQNDFTQVVDGRFKGGHITRHYGRPAAGRHAVQLEMTWRCYMREEPPYELDPTRVATLRPTLRALVQTMLDWRPDA
ncbi:MAG: N-formylglutamate deformylase [Caldimonas sp.]